MQGTERVDTVVVGGGQAGLSVGYHLARRGLPFVILDAHERVGDAWRHRWDSLRLFTPARFAGLAGMPFPGPAHAFPTKDEMADYLEAYAARFRLPVRAGMRVERLWRDGDGFVLAANGRRIEAAHVVVAMSNFQHPVVPPCAANLDSSVVQLHSSAYKNPSQLAPGDVLIVGAGNSGADIALDLVSRHRVWLSGRHPGEVPFRIEGWAARHLMVRLVLRVLFHRVLTVRTPLGRKMRPDALAHSGPLVRIKSRDLAAAGVERVPRVAGVRDGMPLLADGQTLPVANVIWCTGFHPGFSWIDLPIHGEREPRHERGVVPDVPGLYFVGLEFLYALSSAMIHGVGRDAERIVEGIAAGASREVREPVAASAA